MFIGERGKRSSLSSNEKNPPMTREAVSISRKPASLEEMNDWPSHEKQEKRTSKFDDLMEVAEDSNSVVPSHDDPFFSLRRLSHSKLTQHRQLCAILQAIEETILDKQMTLSEAAYFAALMSVLEQQNRTDDDRDDVSSSIVLMLSKLMPKMNRDVLKSRYKPSMELLVKCLRKNADKFSLVRSIVICMSTLLGAADATIWSMSDSIVHPRKVFRGLLPFIVHSCPKVRKVITIHLESVIERPVLPLARHPGVFILGDFLCESLDRPDKGDSSSTLYLLAFLVRVVRFLPSEHVEKILMALKSLLLTNNERISMLIFDVLANFFISSPRDNWGAAQLAQILDSFCKLQPHRHDQNLAISWLKMIEAGFKTMAQVDSEICMKKLPAIIRTMMNMMLSDKNEVRITAFSVLDELIHHCISDKVAIETSARLRSHSMNEPPADNDCRTRL
jgi:ribosomal RNA-processing protein 12